MAAPESHLLEDDGRFPNSRYPVLVYRAVALEGGAGVTGTKLAAAFEQLFAAHGWPAAWRNGLYSEHHYHSTAHEALGVYSGWVQAQLGGERGPLLRLAAGDVLVIPAGVAHCNQGQSKDFRVVGAYPRGTDMDMNYGQPKERPAADRRIAAVPLPDRDPVQGAAGALLELWRRH